jgi:hypothetical protein
MQQVSVFEAVIGSWHFIWQWQLNLRPSLRVWIEAKPQQVLAAMFLSDRSQLQLILYVN